MRLGRPHAIAGLAIVLALLFLAYRFNLPMPSGGQGDSSGQPAVVGVQTARFEALRDALQVPGTVVPTAAGDWTIVAPEAAKIVELPKAQGDSVEAGDLLVRFEVAAISDEITARENEVNEAAARAATAKAEAERLGSLHERGLTPRNTYEAARAALGSAESALAQARGRLESARVIQQVTIIKARFPGVVANRWHNVGDFVTGGPADPVLRVIDPKRVQVAVQLSAAQLARVTPGQYATVQLPGADAVPASVGTRPAPPESGSAATVEVRVTPATPLTLPLETQVQVTIVLDERPKAVVVPSDAIVRDDQTTYVMIAGDDNRAHRRQVHTGLVTGGLTEIISGVTVGERVIVIGLNNVTDGAAIKTGTG